MEHLVEAAASDEVYGIKEQLNDELQEELQDLIDSTTDEELKDILGDDSDWLDDFKDDLEIVADPDDPDWADDYDLDKLRDDLKEYIKKQKPAKLKTIKTKLKKMVTKVPKSVKETMDKVNHGWIHQIDGVTQQSGTVNFITMTPQEEEQYNQEQAQQGGDGTS
jgi:predicted house-cleaning noncanonical NTP pyrophosphatase (MazG superfamily)